MTSAATSGSSANTATVLSKELSFTEKSLSFTNRDITKIALIIVGLVSAVKLFVMAACYFVFGSSIIGSVIFTVGAALLLLSLLAIDARRKTFPPGALPSELYPTHTRDLPLHFAAKLWHLPEVTDFSSDYTSQILQPYTVSAPGISGDLSYDGSALLVRLLGIGRDDWRHHTIFFRDCRLIKREIPNLARHIDGLVLTRKRNVIALDEQPVFITESLSEQLLSQALASTQQLSQEEVATIDIPQEHVNQLGKLILIVNNEFNEKTSPKLFKKLVQTYTAVFSIAIQNDLRSIQLPLLGISDSDKSDFERENLCLLALLHAIQLNLLVQPELAHFRVNHLPKRILERDPKLYARICEYLRDPQKPLPDRSFFKETPILEHVPADRTVQYYSSKSEVGLLLTQATENFLERQKARQAEKLREAAAKEIKDAGDRPTPAPISQETVSAVSALLSSSTARQISSRVKKKPDSRPMSTPTPVAPAPTPVAHTPVTTPEATPTPVAPAPTPVAHTPITTPEATPIPVAPAPTPVAHTPITTPEATPIPVAPAPTPVAHTPITTPEATPIPVAPAPTPVAHTPITTPEATPIPVAPAPTPVAHTPITTPEATPIPVAPAPTPVAHTPITTPEATPTPVAPALTPVAHTPITTPEATPTPVAPAPTPVAHTPITTPEATPTLEGPLELSLQNLLEQLSSLLSLSGKGACCKKFLSTKSKKESFSIVSKCSSLTQNMFNTNTPKDLFAELFERENPITLTPDSRLMIVNELVERFFGSLTCTELSEYLLEILKNDSFLSEFGKKNRTSLQKVYAEALQNSQLSSPSENISPSMFDLHKKGVVKMGKAISKASHKAVKVVRGLGSSDKSRPHHAEQDKSKDDPKSDPEWQ
ncbi:hypothetical protein [Chlamydiifrater volucris]|uniref:hypothetical protein n=1 Tax=Chlamydiifrater volucris TaxID=2681470 RepID=UPI002484D2B9|nr:hypothetical protein [Chlamydiifrater volucris]